MDLNSLVGGLGIGALLTGVVNYFLNRKLSIENRCYQEKRDAYLGLLEALHRAAVEPSDSSSKSFALWQTRVQLFGAEGVARGVQGIIDTNDGPRAEREKYFRQTIEEMRKDLNK